MWQALAGMLANKMMKGKQGPDYAGALNGLEQSVNQYAPQAQMMMQNQLDQQQQKDPFGQRTNLDAARARIMQSLGLGGQ